MKAIRAAGAKVGRSANGPLARRLGWLRGRAPALAFGLAALAGGWATLWSVDTLWDPVAFAVLWTGAALVMWSLGEGGYPGVARHAALALISVPVWWWFELVNERVRNWEYVTSFAYSGLTWFLLSSLAFSTVVPALTAAVSVIRRLLPSTGQSAAARPGLAPRLVLAGLVLQVGVMLFPTRLYPLVWVAPAFVFDGLVLASTGRSLGSDLLSRRWRAAATVAAAGLLCGILWEFWNFWSMPKWTYQIPLLGFGKVFEMPVLGYGGYVPFAWSIHELVLWLDILAKRRTRAPQTHSH